MKPKFCPKCAGRLSFVENREGKTYPVCRSCGFVFYQNAKPTASALILNDQDKVLLLKRAIDPSCGKWDIPGGFLEESEDPIDCLRREVREELGAECEAGEIVAVCVDRYGEGEDSFYTLNLYYKTQIDVEQIKLDLENSEYRWLGKDEIPWNELAFANTAVALTALYR